MAELQSQIRNLSTELSSLSRQHDLTLSERDDLQARLVAAKNEVTEVNSTLTSLKSDTRSLIQEQTHLQKLSALFVSLTARKDDQIDDLRAQLDSLRSVSESMKLSLERAAKDQAEAVAREEELRRKLEVAEKNVKEAKSLRPSFTEETGILLDKLNLNRSALEASLAQKKLGVVELYTRIVTLEEELAKMKKGKEECEMYLEHVLKEVEEKTPQLQQRQIEYQEMVQGQQRLTKMYSATCTELQEKEHKLSMLSASLTEKEQQNEKLERVAKDLQAQLRALLKQQIDASASEDREKLYTTVEDLQATNQRLLERLHTMEMDRENPSSPAESEAIATLEKRLESLESVRHEQEALLSTITKQRDMYRVLLSQKDTAAMSNSDSSLVQSTHMELKKQLEETQRTMHDRLAREEALTTELRDTLKTTQDELSRTKKALEIEKQCGEQSKQTIQRLQASLETVELRTKSLEDNIMTLQQTVSAKQKDLDQERAKACA